MLRFLSIARLAIIDAVELEFGPGLNVITGETGAGKSIVVGAVELLLGGRASPDLVRSGEESAQVQAILEMADGREIIVRREISATGRSRASLDGALVTNAALRELTAPLVDLHGQHDHQTLLDAASHLDLLDQYGGFSALRSEVADAFDAWHSALRALDHARLNDRDRAGRIEQIEFHLREVETVNPRAGEDDELSATRLVLANADRLQRLCGEAFADLYEGDDAVLARLSRVWKRVNELATFDTTFDGSSTARESVTAVLQDLAFTLRERATHVDAQPERLQAIEDRLAALERLKRRHGPTLDDVMAKQQAWALERESLLGGADRREALEREAATARERFRAVARRLSTARQHAAASFGIVIATEMSALAMPDARCEFRLEAEPLPEQEWTRRGIDAGQLFLSTNVGELPKPLARIASGGELSRIMLALKTISSTDAPGKTLIFDEVDAGIGGRAADAVGARLRRLGERFQVLCITHLPQVAAHAHVHYRVEKSTERQRTTTRVMKLSYDQRIAEMARMMGGSASADLIDAARAVLEDRSGSPATVSGESESSRRATRAAGSKAKAKL